MSEPKNKYTFSDFAGQAQAILTLCYLMMIGLGMLFYSQKYAEFGINIFQYATILYFLVAPFEDSLIMQLSAISLVIFAFGFRWDGIIEQRFPRLYTFLYMGSNKFPWFDKYKNWSWPISFLISIIIYSTFYADNAYKRVLKSDDITVNYEDGQRAHGKLIGKTDNVLFLLENQQVKVIPLESMVKNIVVHTLKEEHEQAPVTQDSSSRDAAQESELADSARKSQEKEERAND